ncbi:MAG: hypothetical protein EDX89_23545 [Acidobacteria bacterium]|nr:MAG: hypothetical protein EDX89_23545 [Acidobacteriota bacterium]
MRARWEEIRVSLADSVITIEAEGAFKRAKEKEVALARFESPSSLLSFLTSREGDPDEKNAIYRVLVRNVQARADWADLGTSLLWLGLWPGLDAVFQRNLRFFEQEPGELAARLCELMSLQVHRADLSRIHRLPATFLRNANRDLRRGRAREWAESCRLADLPSDDLLDTDGGVEDSWLVSAETGGGSSLRAWLEAEVGRDADLVEAVAVHGETQKEAGARRGLTHAAARKRYRRALKQLSHSVPKGGVFHVKGAPRR